VLTLLASLLFPLTARGLGQQRPLVARPIDLRLGEPSETDGPRVVMLALDGASLDYISLEVADGRLPNFGRILAAGAALHLATMRPTQPTTVWAAALSGKYPPKNGVRSAATYSFAANQPPIELLPDLCFAHALVRLGILREVSYRPSTLRARMVWSLLSSQRVPVGVVGWALTMPSEPLRGFLLSDAFALSLTTPMVFTSDDLGYPPQAVQTARLLESGLLGGPAERFAAVPLEKPPFGRDAVSSALAARLRTEYQPRFIAVRYQGLDRAGHQFLRYAMPRAFGDVSDEEAQRYGSVMDEHYAYIDAEVGTAMASLGPDDVLLVVSGFGMEPISLGKRLLARAMGDADVTGTHERAPDGFLLAYGESIKPGRALLGSVVDVAPTILYFLGQPVARDMDGYARTDLFKPAFTAARPITFIPTYHRSRAARPAPVRLLTCARPALRPTLLRGDQEVPAAVLRPAAFALFGAERLFLALAHRRDAFADDAQAGQVAGHGLAAALAQREVVLGCPAAVAVPLDRDLRRGPLLHPVRVLRQRRAALFRQVRAVEREKHVTERLLRVELFERHLREQLFFRRHLRLGRDWRRRWRRWRRVFRPGRRRRRRRWGRSRLLLPAGGDGQNSRQAQRERKRTVTQHQWYSSQGGEQADEDPQAATAGHA
jgi:hypothetical protein